MACRRCRRPQTVAEAFYPCKIRSTADVTLVTDRALRPRAEWPPVSEEDSRMNKSMLMGVVAGIGVATAGGVLGYQFLGQQGAEVAVEEPRPGLARDAAPAPAARTAARSRPGRRVLGRGSPGDGRPEGRARDRGHRDRRRGRRRDRQGCRRPRPHDGGRCGGRRFHRPQDPGAKSRRTAPTSARRRPSSAAAARRAALLANSLRLDSRAGPATVRPFSLPASDLPACKCERFATTARLR